MKWNIKEVKTKYKNFEDLQKGDHFYMFNYELYRIIKYTVKLIKNESNGLTQVIPKIGFIGSIKGGVSYYREDYHSYPIATDVNILYDKHPDSIKYHIEER
jgi:hypothetical protein